jgi:RNA polymerase sigma factor (sigma-70 family)
MESVDHPLLTRLLDKHGAALVLYAQQWCEGPEDVVQEAFMRLMHQRPVPDNIVGWLYRVVRNEAVTSSRSKVRRTRHEAAAGSRREPWFKPMIDDALDATAAVAALEALPMGEREVIVLRLWSGLSFEEIADLIGMSTSTAHRRYEMGLDALREKWSVPCLNPKK